MQQQGLKQQSMMQQELYHSCSLLTGPQIEAIFSGNLPPGFDPATCRSVCLGNIHPQVACFSLYPSCSDARLMWDQKTGRSRGFGFVTIRNQQDAQSAIKDLNGKWLRNRQIRYNWAAKGSTSKDDKRSSDAKSVVELTNGTSEEGQEKTNDDTPENNPPFTTVYVGNLAPKVTSVDLHRHFHALGAGTIEDNRVQRDKGFGFCEIQFTC